MASFTSRAAQHVHKIPDATGRKCALANSILGAGGYQPDNDMFDDSIVDYFYNLYEYCVVRGMPWKEVAHAVRFGNEFLSYIPGTPMERAVAQLRQALVDYVQRGLLGSESAKKLTRYFVSTVINHYKLYQLVLTQEQELRCHADQLLVEVPPDGCLLPLAIAETEADYAFNLKMKALSDKRDRRLQEVDVQKEALVERSQQYDQSFDTTLKECPSNQLEFEDAKSLVMHMTSDKLGLVDDNLSLVLTKMREDLTFEIESKALISSRNKPSSRVSSAKSGKAKKSKKK